MYAILVKVIEAVRKKAMLRLPFTWILNYTSKYDDAMKQPKGPAECVLGVYSVFDSNRLVAL